MFKSECGDSRFKVNSFFHPNVPLPSFISTCKNTSAWRGLTALALSSPAAELLWTYLACSQLTKSVLKKKKRKKEKSYGKTDE